MMSKGDIRKQTFLEWWSAILFQRYFLILGVMKMCFVLHVENS